jgi:hypothetical protein
MLTNAEVKSQWSYTSTLSVCLPGMDRDSFTFFFLGKYSLFIWRFVRNINTDCGQILPLKEGCV